MAHFAKIGLNSEVMEVLSVHNDVLKDANGDEQEALGLDFLTAISASASAISNVGPGLGNLI